MYIPVKYGRNIPLIRENAAVCQINAIYPLKSVLFYELYSNQWKNNIAN